MAIDGDGEKGVRKPSYYRLDFTNVKFERRECFIDGYKDYMGYVTDDLNGIHDGSFIVLIRSQNEENYAIAVWPKPSDFSVGTVIRVKEESGCWVRMRSNQWMYPREGEPAICSNKEMDEYVKRVAKHDFRVIFNPRGV